MNRFIAAFTIALFVFPVSAFAQAPANARLAEIADAAGEIEPLETLIISRNGEIVVEEGFRGHKTTGSTNIKSASKSIVSALVGIAIDKKLLTGADQKIAPLLSGALPDNPDPRINDITIGHLLSMQAGLGRTSGQNYGRWVASRNWVRAALAEPFVNDPGSGMLYSTGSTHLLSAILTKVGGKSTRELAREWLGPVEGFSIASWDRDPQGIYLGGNQMAMTPRSLLAFGELFRNRGMADGKRVLSESWIDQSWEPRTRSVFSGEQYGYSWFIADMAGHKTYYAWGYGGQMLYIVPDLGLSVVMTSTEGPSAINGHRDRLHGLMTDIIQASEAA